MYEKYRHSDFPTLAVLPNGKLFHIRLERFLVPTDKCIKENKYYRVRIGNNKNIGAHIVILSYFEKRPSINHEVNHKNGLKYDNRIENLEWITHKENMQHASKNSLLKHPKGKGCILSKPIVQILSDGTRIEHESIHQAAIATGLHATLISKVCKGKRKSTGGYKWEYKKPPKQGVSS